MRTLDERDRFCDTCNTALVSVGEEFIRTEIEFIPAKVRVIDYYRETFECRICRKNGEPYMEPSPMPYPVIQHSMASPSTVAWVMHQKLLQENYLHADETTVQVMNEEGRKNTTDSYMWVYSTGQHCQHPVRIFEYQPGRSGKYPQEFLKGFKGYLHSDGYSVYKTIPNITRCLCWTHLRRNFVDALPKDIHSPEVTLPSQGIAFCNKLFEIEKTLESLSSEQRKLERLKQENSVLEAFWAWVDSNKGNVLPKSKLSDALGYALNHKEEFMNYLKDGNCSISNNLAENSVRPFTIGRKNWLFSGSPKGASASATVYSIIESAKANGLNPYKYLQFIFSELPGVQFGPHPEFLEDYLP